MLENIEYILSNEPHPIKFDAVGNRGRFVLIKSIDNTDT
jgi:hypothetical protein